VISDHFLQVSQGGGPLILSFSGICDGESLVPLTFGTTLRLSGAGWGLEVPKFGERPPAWATPHANVVTAVKSTTVERRSNMMIPL
jgi:hypothetical protein